MVHGIWSSSDKWYGKPVQSKYNTSEIADKVFKDRYWDQYLRFIGTSNDEDNPEGFITVTPNYQENVESNGGWESAGRSIEVQLISTMSNMSNGNGYPPWYYIGHSQGGLLGRAMLNIQDFDYFMKHVRHMFLLGTPNSGGRIWRLTVRPGVDTPFNNIYGYLTEDQVQGRFNPEFPRFGRLGDTDTKVTVYAGNVPYPWRGTDQYVSISSVHKVIEKYCGYGVLFKIPWACDSSEKINIKN